MTTVGTFADALRAHDASLTRTDLGDFAAALAGLVDPPAVGAPLPFDEVSLADASRHGVTVETDLTTAAVRAAATGVCAAGFAVAESGTVVLQPGPAGEEPVSLFPEHHVVVVREADLLPDVAAVFDRLADEFAAGRDDAVLATGPSATADMGELVQGVHGPNEVHVLLVADDAGRDGDQPTAGGESA